MPLETLELTPEERTFLEGYLKTALFETLEPMRRDAIIHIQQRPIGKYEVLGATIKDHKYIVSAREDKRVFRARIGNIPEIYQNQEFFPFGEI